MKHPTPESFPNPFPAFPPVGAVDVEATVSMTGRFRILEEIGRGSSGVVYRAWDPQLCRNVAVKVVSFPDGVTQDERNEARRRFAREAAAAARLSHPNVVQLYDAGDSFLAMELLEGDTLASLMSDGPVSTEIALDVLAQVARALDYAHDADVVHRDIKPANIIVTPVGAKVADFGVAKLLDLDTLLTRHVVGTPRYMAPEQVDNAPVSGATDNFALAVIAYELLTGQPAFPSTSLPALLRSIVDEEPRPPSRLAPRLPRSVDRVLARGMAKAPAKRYARAEDFVRDLVTALAGDSPTRRSRTSAGLQLGVVLAAVTGIGLGLTVFERPPGRADTSATSAAAAVDAGRPAPAGDAAGTPGDATPAEPGTASGADAPETAASPSGPTRDDAREQSRRNDAKPPDAALEKKPDGGAGPEVRADREAPASSTPAEPPALAARAGAGAAAAPSDEKVEAPRDAPATADTALGSEFGFAWFPGSAPIVGGAMVRRVVPGSLAETIGLQPKDVITSWQGRPVATADDLDSMPADAGSADGSVRVEILRDQDSTLSPLTLALTPTDSADGAEAPAAEPGAPAQ